jgi:PHP family Zn ribbon phosphoesterase
MTPIELRAALSNLLAMEELDTVDWDKVQDASINLLNEIRLHEALDYPSELIIPYLSEFKQRRESVEEAYRQRGLLIAYLRARPD